MTVDNTFTIKKLRSLEEFFVTFSQITRMPYVECNPETFDDQVYFFAKEPDAIEFAKGYVEKNIPLLTIKVVQKQFPRFFMGLYAEGINKIVFHDGVTEQALDLEQVFPKPDENKIKEQKLPILNPGVQLTTVYFLQELRKPNQKKGDLDRMKHLRELEEEMLVNLIRSKFILAIDISQVKGEFHPENPGPDIRIPYVQNDAGEIYQPIFSDLGEYQKFQKDPNAKMRLAAIPFPGLLPYLLKQAKGFVINPAGFNLVIGRDQLERMKKVTPEEEQTSATDGKQPE